MANADIIIRNATVIDGSGAAGFEADVAVTGDRVSALGDLGAMTASQEIDAQGQVVAPGFIDVHTHDDRYLFTHPEMAPKASQGVTSVVVGNCGFSLAPWKNYGKDQFPFSLWQDREDLIFATASDFLAQLERTPAALNAAMLVGHSSLRYGAMDDLQRPATDGEIAAMQDSLGDCIDEGAIGMSSGLFYPPAQGRQIRGSGGRGGGHGGQGRHLHRPYPRRGRSSHGGIGGSRANRPRGRGAGGDFAS